jgi:hypothetical protein
MNERIQALMDQAVSFRLDPDSNAYEALVSPEDLAAFAELVVRECAEFAEQKYGNWYRVNAPGDSPSIAIKQYFGVE